jgi:8-oxo-dGTP pyrophosphatase MutT (NUDIX family)
MEPQVIERVRAIILTPGNTILVIKRTRPGVAPYWVLPGGHAEDTDDSLEDALRRELREELGGDSTIYRRVGVIQRENERQYFYLASMDAWSFAAKTGPEFSEARRGMYELEEIPRHAYAIEAIDLRPVEIAAFLTNALRSDGGLAALPDLREPDGRGSPGQDRSAHQTGPTGLGTCRPATQDSARGESRCVSPSPLRADCIDPACQPGPCGLSQ